MSIVYLDGEYMPAEQAKISPMDRGFLFGDGIYEVVPCYDGQFIGFVHHIERLFQGLAAIEIQHAFSMQQFKDICLTLNRKNGGGNLGIYIHVSRGVSLERNHAFPEGISPTLFVYTFELPEPPSANGLETVTYKVNTQEDLRWHRCNIKSTALLGNVMHFQKGHAAGFDETLLFNANDELTEAASCNVFIVKNGTISTPNLDTQKLPGITRLVLLRILAEHTELELEERVITKTEVLDADEIWLTSSTKQVGPVIQVNEQLVANGRPGPIWEKAQSLFLKHQFEYND